MKISPLKNILFILTILAVMVGSCAPAEDTKPTTDDPVEPTMTSKPSIPATATKGAKSGEALEVKSKLMRITSPATSEVELSELVTGNSAFAFDFYDAIRGEEGNLFYSPYSISLALAMTYAGSRGNTEAEMADVLSYTLPQTSLHNTFNALDLALASRGEGMEDDGGFQLNIANSIWAHEEYPFLDEYLDLLGENYGAGLRLVNFVSATEDARLAINEWVSDKTEEKIKDLIPAGAIDTLTRLVLANAIYFKADWQMPFEPERTSDEPFFLTDGMEIQVPMMSMSRPPMLPYVRGNDYEAVELPYKGGQLSMVVVVPDAGLFTEIEGRFSNDLLTEILTTMTVKGVDLTLPKFQYESMFGLSKTLQTMGMTDAFEWMKADFSGMDGTRDLFIKNVLHKAFVSVDEEGTEAAAATAVIVGIESMPVLDVVLTVDRPFLFLIRDIPTGSILFVGRVLDPSH